MKEEEYIGVIDDPRSELAKSFDYTAEGVASAGVPLVWVEKENFKSYLIKNQDGSSSCVSQATAKLLGMHEVFEGRDYKNLSPKYIYTRRSNYPGGGMWFQNSLDIACKDGTCLESQLPSDMKGESFMNDKTQETEECRLTAPEYKGKNYVTFTTIDINKIAEAISQGYGVLLGFKFDYDEWITVPFINPQSKLACHHGIVGTDFGLLNGVKVISIDDSWGPGYGKGGQRFITEEFLLKRCTYAGYALSFVKEVIVDNSFHYNWKKVMTFDKRQDKNDVKALQTALQTIALFPLNAKIDGLYGPITRKAVYDFQRKYVGFHNYGIQVGPKTLVVLNNKFK